MPEFWRDPQRLGIKVSSKPHILLTAPHYIEQLIAPGVLPTKDPEYLENFAEHSKASHLNT